MQSERLKIKRRNRSPLVKQPCRPLTYNLLPLLPRTISSTETRWLLDLWRALHPANFRRTAIAKNSLPLLRWRPVLVFPETVLLSHPKASNLWDLAKVLFHTVLQNLLQHQRHQLLKLPIQHLHLRRQPMLLLLSSSTPLHHLHSHRTMCLTEARSSILYAYELGPLSFSTV